MLSVFSSRKLAFLFIWFGILGIFDLTIITPPFQCADELAHFMRAEQISTGHLVGHKLGTSLSGGAVNTGIAEMSEAFVPWVNHDAHIGKATSEMYETAGLVRWSQSSQILSFANTAIYPPFLYAPSVIGIWIGKAANIGVLSTLRISRCLSGLTSVAIGAMAIVLAEAAAPLLFTFLLLPMSSLEMAAITQDGLMYSLAALGAALVCRLLRKQSYAKVSYIALCACLALIIMAKPPYLPLVVFAFIPPVQPRLLKLAGIAAVTICGLGWTHIAGSAMVTGIPPANQNYRVVADTSPFAGADLNLQVAAFRQHIPNVSHFIRAEIKDTVHLSSEFIGVVGWTDVPLPKVYKPFAFLALFAAAWLSADKISGIPRRNRFDPILIVLALVGGAAGICVALYFSFSPVGAERIFGLQGRYFLPLAILGTSLLSYIRVPAMPVRLRSSTLAMLEIFPAISLVIVTWTVMERYYF